MTYRRPWDFAYIEELVVTSNDNPVFLLFARAFPTLVRLSCEQAASESWERGWDIVVLELVHLPAPDGHLWGFRGDIFRTFDQLWIILGDPYQLVDEFVVFSRVGGSHGG